MPNAYNQSMHGHDQRETERKSVKTGDTPAHRRLIFWLRLLISVGLMAVVVFFYVPAEDRVKILQAYADLHLGWLFLAVLVTFSDRLVSGIKWLLLLRNREPGLQAGPVLQVFFVSTLFGYFLPSSIGGDAVRIYGLNRVRRDLAGSTSSVVIDRAYGVLSLLLLSAVAIIPATGTAVSVTESWLLWATALAAVVGVLLLSSRRVNRWTVRLLSLEGKKGWRKRLQRLFDAFFGYLDKKWNLVFVFLLSLCVQILRVLIVVFMGYSLGLEIGIVSYFIYVPLIIVATLLPVSIAGLGVREALFVVFFTRPEIGLSEQQAVSLSLLFFTSGIIATLPGLAVFTLTGMGKRAESGEGADPESSTEYNGPSGGAYD